MRAIILLTLLLSASFAMAEPFPIQFTEPAAQAGTLLETRVYVCCTNGSPTSTCTNWQLRLTFPSDDGNGGDVKNGTFDVPVNESELPKTCRASFTSINASKNESSRASVIITHTFDVP